MAHAIPSAQGNEGVLGFLDDSNNCHYLINTSFPHASWQGGRGTDTFHRHLSTLHFGARLDSSTENHLNRNNAQIFFFNVTHKKEILPCFPLLIYGCSLFYF